VAKATSVIAQREHELIVRLSKAAEFRDPETGAHISRMANYSLIIAEGLRLTAEECDLILQSAPMHDVGKLGIPDGILLKPGKLDADEFAIMQTHTTIGHAILRDSSSQLIALGAEIALTHHEKFDGSGYPAGLAGETIPLPGRIVAVADVFDALTSERPYKPAWTVERARALLEENRGSHFDPACVDAFLADWERALEVRERFADEQPAKG
jgi:putative two-component system response regulator